MGQSVFIRSQYFQTTRPSKKLSEKYLRLYKIIAQPSLQSFTLHLPDTMRAAHPVFHVSMLEPATPNTFQQCSESLPVPVTNFIWPYLHQFFNDSHSLNSYRKPLKRPFNRYQSCLEAISDGRDIRQINW